MTTLASHIDRRLAGWILPFALTVGLLWYLFRKVDFPEMIDIIRKGCDYWWILAAMAISILSHMVRAARWRLQLRSLGINPPYMALCCSIFGCYALNLIFPRLGELWRCTYISRRQKAPFTTVLGSMVSDRLADTAAVATLLLLTFLVANSAINAFLTKYPVGRDLIDIAASPWLWIGIAAACALAWGALRIWRDTKFVERLRQWCHQLWEGFASVGRMKGKGWFVVLTFLLWGCYFVQLYVAFFAFPFTRALCGEPRLGFGLEPCLVAFVLSSIGMAVPSNGGLGPWNIAVMFGLAIYGISDTEGTAFSMLQWSGQTVMLIILGIFTMFYISGIGRRHADLTPPDTKGDPTVDTTADK